MAGRLRRPDYASQAAGRRPTSAARHCARGLGERPAAVRQPPPSARCSLKRRIHELERHAAAILVAHVGHAAHLREEDDLALVHQTVGRKQSTTWSPS